MIPNKILSIPFAFIVALLVLFTGCGSDGGTGSGGGAGSMTVEMTDAPIDSADAVNVFIERVEVNREGSSEGWITLNEPQQEYDLLELTNGATTVLGSAELEAGTYQQIRLVLSQDGHSLEVGEDVYNLTVPSGAQTGIKLNIDAEIEADVEYVLLLDFDASRSVVKAGQSGMYLLKPVIKAKEKAITGNIEGTIDPAEAEPVVYAIANLDTMASTVADTSDGYFKLIGLEEGGYDLSVDPRNDDYEPTSVEGVDVTVGETNNIGTVELSSSSGN